MPNHFVERTLRSALAFVQGTLFAEEIAAQKGLLQSLDARVRTVSLLALIVTVVLAQSLGVLFALYAASLVLASLSGIRLGYFFFRTWVFIPLFSLFIALPAVFSFVTPGETLGRLGPLEVTRPGLFSAAFFLMRVAGSVSFAVLLALTTRHFELLKVLRIFGVPQVFVMILGMAYRYIYLLLETVQNMHAAVKSRVGTALATRQGQHLVAWGIGGLWMKSYRLSDQVYQAMLSRGYRGEPVLLKGLDIRPRDWLFLAVLGMALFFLVYAGFMGAL